MTTVQSKIPNKNAQFETNRYENYHFRHSAKGAANLKEYLDLLSDSSADRLQTKSPTIRRRSTYAASDDEDDDDDDQDQDHDQQRRTTTRRSSTRNINVPRYTFLG